MSDPSTSSSKPVAESSQRAESAETRPAKAASPEAPAVVAVADGEGDEEHVEPLEVDHASDSGFGDDEALSETTSVASSLIRGHIENGRKYSTLRHDYWGPSDEQQFETLDAGHFFYLLMESERSNSLFRSPIRFPRHVLDIGTGTGTWAIDVSDKFPDAQVYGVDLYPPPNTWVPPNCFLEVQDVLQEWTWRHRYDLIHMRLMLGAFTDDEWDAVYRTAYENLIPGGWIEQVELDVRVMCDDGTLATDSLLAGWGDNFLGCSQRSGRSLSTQTTMADRMARAGFVNIHDDLFKCPLGSWPKDRRLKEAGRVNFHHWSSGLDGWAMWLLTRYGSPQPWSADEVRVYVAKVRAELKQKGLHVYHLSRRVWAQKPLRP